MLNAELKSMNSILTYESFFSRCVRAGRRAVAEKREFTRKQLKEGILKQSRIDLVLVKEEIIRYIDRIRHQGNSLSDHDTVWFRIKIGNEEVGGGMWILNAGYIEE